jgi:phosphoribosylformylglycinamidine synthase subunit PurQ / glutaminase
MAQVAVVHFPGSLVEELTLVLEEDLGISPTVIWHQTERLPADIDLLIIPGGSAFCDYLRPGALAKSSPIAASIRRFARSGKVLGIGNGFQILTELEVLPGAFLPNLEGQAIVRRAKVATETASLCKILSGGYPQVSEVALSCVYGRYYVDQRTLTEIQEQIVFRYSNDEGAVETENPPTGSAGAVAGVCSVDGKVLGVMFHPERSADGKAILRAAL